MDVDMLHFCIGIEGLWATYRKTVTRNKVYIVISPITSSGVYNYVTPTGVYNYITPTGVFFVVRQ